MFDAFKNIIMKMKCQWLAVWVKTSFNKKLISITAVFISSIIINISTFVLALIWYKQ
jgi:hypothetical protein